MPAVAGEEFPWLARQRYLQTRRRLRCTRSRKECERARSCRCPGRERSTRRTLENVKAVLEAGGASVEDVVMFRVYLTDRAHFGPMNDEYATFLAEHVTSGALPCRTTVFTGLPLELMLIEIDALAVLD